MQTLPTLPEELEKYASDPEIARYSRHYKLAWSVLQQESESEFAQFQLAMLERSAHKIAERVEMLHLFSMFDSYEKNVGRMRLQRRNRLLKKKPQFTAA